ncbi:MAG: RNase adapter RapZ [Oscillospiraceae bacterium]
MDLLIVTGMSGSGKSNVVDALEDIGFYCVDNIPANMIGKFIDLCTQISDKLSKLAIVVDVRSTSMFGDFSDEIESILKNHEKAQILFLECQNDILSNRYKLTRRKHPLVDAACITIEQALQLERRLLENTKNKANIVIDTTHISVAQLKERVCKTFATELTQNMLVNCTSFGFKHGILTEADLVFDLRCFPNPFYIPELKELTGLDENVKEYVLKFPQTTNFISKLTDMLDYLIPFYIEEGKRQLVIGFGCTGGKHRSVVFAQLIGTYFQEKNINTIINHRDYKKG